MSVVAVATPFNIDLEFNIASFGKRLLAWIIDTVIQLAYLFIYVKAVEDSLPHDDAVQITCAVLFCALPLVLYHFVFELLFNGQSIGKKILGIRVVNLMGNRASISQLLIRLIFRSFTIMPLVFGVFADLFKESFAVVIPVFLLLMIAVFVMYLNSKLGQRFGDRIADTIVIENKAKADFQKTIYLELDDSRYQPQYPEVMRLTDRDINGIRNLLDQRRVTRDTQAYMDRIATRICEVLGVQTNMDAFGFLSQLLRDYNFLTRK